MQWMSSGQHRQTPLFALCTSTYTLLISYHPNPPPHHRGGGIPYGTKQTIQAPHPTTTAGAGIGQQSYAWSSWQYPTIWGPFTFSGGKGGPGTLGHIFVLVCKNIHSRKSQTKFHNICGTVFNDIGDMEVYCNPWMAISSFHTRSLHLSTTLNSFKFHYLILDLILSASSMSHRTVLETYAHISKYN